MPLIKKPATGWKFSTVTTHPGIVLLEEFLKPLGISQNKLAMDIRVPATRVGETCTAVAQLLRRQLCAWLIISKLPLSSG
jgi:hypothetical protein